jgi:putative transposase
MLRLLRLLTDFATRFFLSRRDLLLEKLTLRQQLAALSKRHPQPRFAAHDKLFWVILRRLWPGWKRVLGLIQPETAVRWHRAGFKLYWTWLWQSAREESVSAGKLRELVYRMIAENATWGRRAFMGN